MIPAATSPPARRMDPTERRTLVGCALGGGILLLAPGEYVGAGLCLVLAIALLAHHIRATLQEERAARAALPPTPDAGNPTPPLATG